VKFVTNNANYRIFYNRTSEKRIYNKRTALKRINGRLDRNFNLENNKVRRLIKTTVIKNLMIIGMLAMAKGHIINQ